MFSTHERFYIIPPDCRWEIDIMEYRDNTAWREKEFRKLLTKLGLKAKGFTLYRHDVSIGLSTQDKKRYERYIRKYLTADGQCVIRHNSPLYRAWSKTKAFREFLTEPMSFSYFSSAAALHCEVIEAGGKKYCRATAYTPFDTTDSLIPIKGSEFYTAVRDLYLEQEAEEDGKTAI